ncbi:MAG: hypothetical protein QOE22_668 [Candidatus Parcubacteria bacterium]|jgi:hypothetical protein|nr:hypothetical protein [Candidatus Parcubacteria bacterium]
MYDDKRGMDMAVPEQIPEAGFYYHYKHDPEGPEENYAYELLAVGHHTEEDSRPEDKFLAVYRPLYESALVYRLGRMYDVRPLGMFMEPVTRDGKEQPRFSRVTDPELIGRLEERRDRMYP